MFKNINRPMLGTTWRMAWPAIIESVFLALAGLIDSFMISSMGAVEVAAVGLTTQPKFIGLAPFFALNVAISALVARRRGENDKKKANQILLTGIILTIILGIIVSIIMVTLAPQIISACGSNSDTHGPAVTYFRIIMAGITLNGLQIVVNAAQRGSGNTRISMTTNVVSSIVNIIFNYLLIGGHFGFPALGITGAAIATVFGTFIAVIMCFVSLRKSETFVSIPFMIKERIKPTVKALSMIIHVAYSVFFEQLLMRVGFVLTAVMAAHQGTNAMAAHQVAMNIMGVTFGFGDGLQAAAVALIGRSLGEGDLEKAKNYGDHCKFIGSIITVALALVYFFGARGLFSLFFREDEIITIGAHIMYMIVFIQMFQIRQVIYMGCLRGAGDTLYTAVVGMICVVIIRSVVSYVFCYPIGLGIIGIWCGVLADQLGRYIFSMIRYKRGKWIYIKI